VPTITSIPQFVQEKLAVGSQWRKWDLHIHGPFAVFNNQFGDPNNDETWEAYISGLEKLHDIPVLGITDYFSIDTYKRLRVAKEGGRLKNIALLVPNIEFRLNILVPTKAEKDNAKVKKINAHIIFSDLVSPEDIEENFLSRIQFVAYGAPDATSERRALSRYQLEQFGESLKAQQPEFEGSNYHIGCMNASVDLEAMKEILLERRSIFEDKYLIFIAGENLSLISWLGQGHQLRKSLVQGTAGFFGNASDREWLLGVHHPTPEEFVKEFGSLKPCIQGSDAHGLDGIGEPVDGKFCWIKADPTFEGLRQITFEPNERVMLVDSLPELKHPFRILRSVEVKDAPDWFSYATIPLNADLVSIIGGKGAGKSALAELIAYAGGSETFRGRKRAQLQDTFLFKASKRTSANLRPITGATVTLTWADGSADSITITDDLDHKLSDEKVKYLPQKFVEEVCHPDNHQELLREMERVIFSRIPRADRLGLSTFADLREQKNRNIQVSKDHLADEIAVINREVFASFERVNSKAQKEKALADLKKSLTSLLKSRPDTTDVKQADLDRLKEIQIQLQRLEGEIAAFQSGLSTINEIEARYATQGARLALFNAEIPALLKSVGLDSRATEFLIRLPTSYQQLLDAKKAEFSTNISLWKEGPRAEPTVAASRSEEKSLRDSLNLSQTKRATFEKFEKDRIEIEEQISSYEKELLSIDATLAGELKTQRTARVEKFLDYFVLLKREKAALDDLYKPLKDALSQDTAVPPKLEFESRISFDFDGHTANGIALFDSRKKGRFADGELLQRELKKLLSDMESADFARDLVKDKLLKFRDELLKDSEGKKLEPGALLRKNKTEEDFNNWFYSLAPYRVEYSIAFEGRELSLLSPGQKGIVLLMVYLEVDQDDQRPLVIDQPEDNLDNLSVYSNLIRFFRKRKVYRQIVLVTHNPNLVVNTDSEQIIIASYSGERNPKIAYKSGAIEDSRKLPPGIREEVCAILEGGTEAFRRRELKYSLT